VLVNLCDAVLVCREKTWITKIHKQNTFLAVQRLKKVCHDSKIGSPILGLTNRDFALNFSECFSQIYACYFYEIQLASTWNILLLIKHYGSLSSAKTLSISSYERFEQIILKFIFKGEVVHVIIFHVLFFFRLQNPEKFSVNGRA
jgi:hypothetical protein